MGGKPCHHAGAIGRIPVLAQLEFALEPLDFNLDPHHGRQHLREVVAWGIAHPPRARHGRLVFAGQACQQSLHEARIVMHPEPPMGVSHGVVPGGHRPVVLGLTRIPVGRDIPLGAAKDHQHRAAVRLLPQRIGARHMGQQVQGVAPLFDQKRQVVGIEGVFVAADERPQRVGLDECDERCPFGGKVGGQVHGASLADGPFVAFGR